MITAVLGTPSFPDPWRYQANPEVWLLVGFLIGAYIYSIRVIGPRAVALGEPVVTRRQVWCFVTAMVILFTASTWPIHQIGEDYLYSVHMFQHMMLSYFLPPLVLLATPEWLLRTLVGTGRGYRVLRFLTEPIVAGVAFNALVMIVHIPGVVNASVQNGALHYLLHVLVVMTGVWMWTPIVGPFKEWHLTPIGKCSYLFVQSVIPMVPAGWLTFADGVVYKRYEQPVRVWGLSVTEDQQLAGAVMKTGGTVFIWSIIVFIFMKRFGVETSNTYRRGGTMPTAEIVGHDEHPLTYEQVTAAFDRTPAP